MINADNPLPTTEKTRKRGLLPVHLVWLVTAAYIPLFPFVTLLLCRWFGNEGFEISLAFLVFLAMCGAITLVVYTFRATLEDRRRVRPVMGFIVWFMLGGWILGSIVSTSTFVSQTLHPERFGVHPIAQQGEGDKK